MESAEPSTIQSPTGSWLVVAKGVGGSGTGPVDGEWLLVAGELVAGAPTAGEDVGIFVR